MKRLLGLVVVGMLALLALPAMADTVGGGPATHTNDPEVYNSDFSVTVNANSTSCTFGTITSDGVLKTSGGAVTMYQQSGTNGSGFNITGTYSINGGADTPGKLRVYFLKGVIDPATGQPGTRAVVIVYDMSGNRLYRLDGFMNDPGGVTIN